MSDDTIMPVFAPPPVRLRAPAGRPADAVATLLAALGAIMAVIGAIWFFAGFAENDTRPEHLLSALLLTLGLFSLAIIPFASVAEFARRAYQKGGRLKYYLWTLFLMLPWIGLGLLAVSYTPLPIWTGWAFILLSSLLSLWALLSLILDRRQPTSSLAPSDTSAVPPTETSGSVDVQSD